MSIGCVDDFPDAKSNKYIKDDEQVVLDLLQDNSYVQGQSKDVKCSERAYQILNNPAQSNSYQSGAPQVEIAQADDFPVLSEYTDGIEFEEAKVAESFKRSQD